MPVNGVILLGYARSAGSGDQAVPGVVTSRRDRGVREKQKLRQAAEQEEERKKRERQEVAAQYLKRKWKEDDEKRKRKSKKTDKEGEVVVEKPPTRQDSDSEDNEEEQKTQQKDDGKWVSKEDVVNRVHQEKVVMQTNESARPGAHASGSGPQEPERRGFLPGAPKIEMNPALQQQRKKALANAFGLDDDDDGEARRELELASRIKRQRVDVRGPMEGSSSTPATAAPAAAPSQMSQFDQLRKLAEWKRKCKGNRIPMPDDLVAAIGMTAGLQHNEPQTTLGGPVLPGCRTVESARSRSRSRGELRRLGDNRKRSRSRSRRRR